MGNHVSRKEKVFNKKVFLASSGKKNLFLMPTFVLHPLYLIRDSWHQFECSRVFYMPRFIEENPEWSFLKHGKPEKYLKSIGKNLYLFPYLQDVNQRYQDLVDLIEFKNLNVIDLNAGHGNLYSYLPKGTHYRGNDIFPQNPHVEQLEDSDFVKTVEKIDVLCIFGWATGGVFVESDTQNDSIDYLLTHFQPRYFVAESISEYEPLIRQKFSHFFQVYDEIARFDYEVSGRHSRRSMLVFQLKEYL